MIGCLPEYLTHLHESGQSPATISKLVGQSPLDYWLAFVGKVETGGRGQLDGLTREGMLQSVLQSGRN